MTGAVLSSPAACKALRRASMRPRREVEMDTIERTARSTAQSLPSLPLRLHHHAYVVKDHEANRRFIEDLLGIPLVATWCEKSHNSESGEEIEFCHTCFGLADGSALAFFGFADPTMCQRPQAEAPAGR